MHSNRIHIVYASDDRFTEILGVSLISLYENNKDVEEFVIYILDSGIKIENRNRIESISKKYNRTVPVWIKAQDISKVLAMKVVMDRGSLSQYARLFVSSDLPADLDRVIYLDCDVVVNKSIKELWNLDLHGKTIAALMDAFSNQYRVNIGLEKNDIMFNSGVMLIDLRRWKKQKIEEKLLRFIEIKKGRIQQGDQGALNAILSHDTYCFEPHFNAVTIYYDFNYDEIMVYRKPADGFYSRKEIKNAVENPTIIHYTTSFLSKRPWIIGSQHKYTDVWLYFKSLSPWKSVPPWNDNIGAVKRIAIGILKKMPRDLMIKFAGLAQAYGRPWKNRIVK